MGPRTPSRAAAPVPRFPERKDPRPRVVVEDEDTASRLAAVRRLRAAGYEVLGCGGPATLSRRRCPLEQGGTCPAIRDADAVVTSLRRGTGRQVAVLAAIRAQHPDLPVIVRTSALIAHRHRSLLDGCQIQIGVGLADLPPAVDRAAGQLSSHAQAASTSSGA